MGTNFQLRIDQDLKSALLARDTLRTSVLRSLKNAIGYAEVAQGARGAGLDEQTLLTIIAKQAKQRQESADLYVQGGDQVRAEAELAEKAIIEQYLPAQLSEAATQKIVDEVIANLGSVSQKDMGRVIGDVRTKTAGGADGAMIARLVKERLAA